jgi:hypothetical protein
MLLFEGVEPTLASCKVRLKFDLFLDEKGPCPGDCCLLGNPKNKVLMNIAASFPSVKKPRYVVQKKSRQYD